MNVKSGSDLSIKKAVNLYTIIVLIGFALLLLWLAVDRYQYHVDTNANVASNATSVAAAEVRAIIENKQRIVDIFTDDFSNLIAELARDPDDEDLHQAINSRIRKYLPDFFASNIMTSLGEPIIGDFDGFIGGLCLADLESFIKSNKPSVRVHPNQNAYHYDIVSRFSLDGVSHIFFVSFNLSEIGHLLNAVQPAHHKLMLINKNDKDLIEVTQNGGRETIKERLNYRLTGDEKIRILSSTKVPDTQWHVIDMHDESLLIDYRDLLIKEYLIVYIIFSILALYMRSILANQDTRRSIAEINLMHSNEDIKDLNQKLEELSITDGLTGLHNRRYFDKRIKQEWNRSLRSKDSLSCILIDIDYFKQYNDCYGHVIGDECLKVVANLMLDVFRRAGDLVARYGGEEFVVVMTDCSLENSKNAVLQLQKALEDQQIAHSNSLVSDYLTISAGLFNTAPKYDDTIKDFISNADKALYMAKAAGRNRLVMYGQDLDV